MAARYQLARRGVFDRVLGRVILPTDPEWRAWQAALAAGEAFDPAPADAPAQDPRFDPIIAGRTRAARQFDKLAKRDPVAAAIAAAGIGNRRKGKAE